jgi:hypothetical protein
VNRRCSAARRAAPALLAGLALACRPTAPITDRDPSPLHEGPAEISGLSLVCYPDGGRWSLQVATSAWSGAGLLLWGDRDDRVEAHNFLSSDASADGSGDCLSLSLSIRADPREVSPGSSTRFGCEQLGALTARVFVADTQAERWTDCRAWGDQPEVIDAREGVPLCERPLAAQPEAPADTGAPLDTGAAQPVGLGEGTLGACG